jgi:hypothetical protein
MLKLTQDGEHVGDVSLVNGKLVVTGSEMAQHIVDEMRDFNGHALTDAEAFKMMPARLTGRVAATPKDGSSAISREDFIKMVEDLYARGKKKPAESGAESRDSLLD